MASTLNNNLRVLFRNIVQPVAVVTSFMPNHAHKFHGATLSSFTSIAMDPYPLVSFALRLPSRMATSLSSSSAHMVINLLAAHQSNAAVIFSRPDIYSSPFESQDLKYSLSDEGLPVLKGVVGALSCKLVRKGIPLHDLDYLATGNLALESKEPVLDKDAVPSALFIAKVVRIESITEQASPLVYYQRGYSTSPS